jgi:hypothetical protein
VTANCSESYREYVATFFKRESNSWRAGSLPVPLRAADWQKLAACEIFIYTGQWIFVSSESKNMAAAESAICEHAGVNWGRSVPLSLWTHKARFHVEKFAFAVLWFYLIIREKTGKEYVIIIIIFIDCNWVDTRWQWSFNMLHTHGLWRLLI